MQRSMVNCDLLLRMNRRSLCIQIGKNGEVIVKAPLKLSDQKINEFLSKKQNWIDKHVQNIKNNKQQYDSIIKAEQILYFNELFLVKETYIKNSSFQDNILYIKNCNSFEDKLKEIKKWYLRTAEKILKDRLEYFSNILQLNFSKFKLTNAKSKWGSCSTKREIQLNWRLIMLDSDLQDYVIVHELCHLLEMNHSTSFYKCIESVIPDYKIRRNKIKSCGFLLQLYR